MNRGRRVRRVGRVLVHGFLTISWLVAVATVVLIVVAIVFVFVVD